MDPAIQKKIDAALARVIEPQSELPIVDLGLVSNVRYNGSLSSIEITLARGFPQGMCKTCAAIDIVTGEGLERRTREAFEKEFPGFNIIVD
jgi:metal-sulfur cluster biosynthetic enzyme